MKYSDTYRWGLLKAFRREGQATLGEAISLERADPNSLASAPVADPSHETNALRRGEHRLAHSLERAAATGMSRSGAEAAAGSADKENVPALQVGLAAETPLSADPADPADPAAAVPPMHSCVPAALDAWLWHVAPELRCARVAS